MNPLKRTRPIAFAVGAVMALAGSAAVQAQPPTSSVSGGAAMSLAKDDQKFITKAAVGGMTEVQLGSIAQKNAASDQVKAFGARMVRDHSAANEELKQVASAKGLALPTALDKSHQKDVDKFSKLSGADFDKKYTKYMVSDHKEDIDDFGKAAKSAKDAEVKGFATKTLPVLQMHLQMAQSANDAVKNSK